MCKFFDKFFHFSCNFPYNFLFFNTLRSYSFKTTRQRAVSKIHRLPCFPLLFFDFADFYEFDFRGRHPQDGELKALDRESVVGFGQRLEMVQDVARQRIVLV